MTREPTDTFEVFPFRYRDARTGRWVKARYKATRDEIAARYAEWEVIGPGEVRQPGGGVFQSGAAGEGVILTPEEHAGGAQGPIRCRV
jgi:hypothetical protein